MQQRNTTQYMQRMTSGDQKFRFGWVEREAGRDTHICKGFAETRKQGDE